jgi:ATP phosphoribosyltransferase regulatory subunit
VTPDRERAPPPEIAAAIRAPFEAFGGAWTETAVLQPLGLLLDLAGEAMRARLIVVSGGVEDKALRPDFTIPVAVAHIAEGAEAGRYLYAGDAFRVAPQGSGRPAEFGQIGAEVLGGSTDPVADDAAIAALAWAAARAGGRQDLTLRFGDVSLFHAFLTALGLPEPMVLRLVRALPSPRLMARELYRAAAPAVSAGEGRLAAILADLPEEEAASVLQELWRLAGIQPVGGRAPAEIVHRLAHRAEAGRTPPLSDAESGLIRRYLAISGPPRSALEAVDALANEGGGDIDAVLEAWVRRLKALQADGVPADAMTLSAGFSPPFGYYDGVLFEVTSASLANASPASDEPIAAGGRYDGLPERLGGPPGAVGCMVRPALAWEGGA